MMWERGARCGRKNHDENGEVMKNFALGSTLQRADTHLHSYDGNAGKSGGNEYFSRLIAAHHQS